MGGAPAIVTIRPGVQLEPAAAASFRRVEADLGRRIDVNSTYRDWGTQLRMHNAWNAYVAGRGPYPGHSRAIHPRDSKHCMGLGLDSDEWVSPSLNAFMADRGWIRTAANDPTERHHYEYQWRRDNHRNRPAPSGDQKPAEQPRKRRKQKMVNAAWRLANGTYAVQYQPRGRITLISSMALWKGLVGAQGIEPAQLTEAEGQELLSLYGQFPNAVADMEHATGMSLVHQIESADVYLITPAGMVKCVDPAKTIPQLEGRVPELYLPAAEVSNLVAKLGK